MQKHSAFFMPKKGAKMPRLTPKQKSEILTDYVSGKSQSEIARKFKVSVTTISKILKTAESLKNSNKSLNREQLGNSIIEKAPVALYGKDFNVMHPETLLKIIERLSLLYNAENGTQNGNKGELKIIVEKKVVDLSNPKKDG